MDGWGMGGLWVRGWWVGGPAGGLGVGGQVGWMVSDSQNHVDWTLWQLELLLSIYSSSDGIRCSFIICEGLGTVTAFSAISP